MPPLAKLFVPAAFAAVGGLAAGSVEAQSTDGPATTVVVAAPNPSGDAAARRPAGTPTKYGTGVRTAKGARFWPGGGGGEAVDDVAGGADGDRTRFRTQPGEAASGSPQEAAAGVDSGAGDAQGGVARTDNGQRFGAAEGVGGAAGASGQGDRTVFNPIEFGSAGPVPSGFDGGGSVTVPVNPGAFVPNVAGPATEAAPTVPRQSASVRRNDPGLNSTGPGAAVVPAVPFVGPPVTFRSTTVRSDTGFRDPATRRRTSTFGGRGPRPPAEAFGYERSNGLVVEPAGAVLYNGSASGVFGERVNP